MLLPLDRIPITYYDDILDPIRHAEITKLRYEKNPICNQNNQHILTSTGAYKITQLPQPFNILDISQFDDLSTLLTGHHLSLYRELVSNNGQ
eukprot:UN07517